MDCAPAIVNPTVDDTMRIYNQMRCLEAQYPGYSDPAYNEAFRKGLSVGFDSTDICKHIAMSIELTRRAGSEPGMVEACETIAGIMLNTPFTAGTSNGNVLRALEKLTFRVFYPDLYDYVINALEYNNLRPMYFPLVFRLACKFLYENPTMRISLASEIGMLLMCKKMDITRELQVRIDSDEDVTWINKLVEAPGAYKLVKYVPDCGNEVKYAVRETPRYAQKELIGEGTYGAVSIVEMDGVGNDYVMKTFKNTELNEDTLTELSVLTSLKHPNVIFIEYLKATLDEDTISMGIFMKRYAYDLGSYIHEKEVSPESARLIMRSILSGLAYIHAQNIIHRDLKPGNILINNRNDVRIADFGMAKYVPSIYDTVYYTFCTQTYRAPEIMLMEDMGSASYASSFDMWSAGCIFYELLTGDVLFGAVMEETPEALLKLRFAMLGKPTVEQFPLMKYFSEYESMPDYERRTFIEEIPDERARSLLCLLLTYDPMRRITAERALAHPYFG